MRPNSLVQPLVVCLALCAQPLLAQDSKLTLEQIMADPDWISRRPEAPYWSDDGQRIYYQRKRAGSDLRDLFAVDLATGASRQLTDAERATTAAPGGDWNSTWTVRAFTREGDVYLRDSKTGTVRQLTRTATEESRVQFQTGDQAISYRRGDDWFIRDLATGLEAQAGELRLDDDPLEKEPADDYLSRQQERLLDIVRLRRERREAADKRARELRAGDPARLDPPFYLGKDQTLLGSALSPNGRWLLVQLGPKTADEGKSDKMPDFITASGYVEPRDVRPKVGTPKPVSPKVMLLDLQEHRQWTLDLAGLTGIDDDPLKELRAKAEEAKKARAEARKPKPEAGDKNTDKSTAKPADPVSETKAETKAETKPDEKTPEEKKPAQRVVSLDDVLWNEAGDRVLLQFFAFDNKDRWIAAVEPGAATPDQPAKLHLVDRITDPAWINWDFRELGWMRDGRTAWYLSEESGYSHIHLRGVAKGATGASERQLTTGKFTVDAPVLSRDGKRFWVRASREHPGVNETYRVDVGSGALTRVTHFDGMSEAVVSPDESKLAVLASFWNRPPELYVQDNREGAKARKLTDTITAEFSAISWTTPEFVPVPSTHDAGGPVWARVYRPANWSADRKWPAVAFVHGAGYLQNVHKGWSGYFREFMFHSLLTQQGYVVIDMDFRASAGYGRDWRTAIYRQMGTPELDDYRDGIAWLAANASVDPARIGVYGGSYGGFIAFMALFKDPDLFACGAALRPVSDWAHYNHPYTANILNTPEIDPEAYEKSSPIEFAAGLRKPLLILHGMVDDNVVFQDTVRLVQKLIELEKTEYFETAIYPVEVHTFREASNWLDEYKRIYYLMEENLKR